MTRQIGGPTREGAQSTIAVASQRSQRLALEAQQLVIHEPVGQTDPPTGKPETSPQACRAATHVVRAHRGGDLRLNQRRLARELAATLSRFGDLTQRHSTDDGAIEGS